MRSTRCGCQACTCIAVRVSLAVLCFVAVALHALLFRHLYLVFPARTAMADVRPATPRKATGGARAGARAGAGVRAGATCQPVAGAPYKRKPEPLPPYQHGKIGRHGRHGRPGARRVRFTEGTKKHDGTSAQSDFLETYLRSVFGPETGRGRAPIMLRDLAGAGDADMLVSLQALLRDLMDRCTSSSGGSTPVLPRGGGKAGSIDERHIPHLRAHDGFFANAVEVARNVARSRKHNVAEVQAGVAVQAQETAHGR